MGAPRFDMSANVSLQRVLFAIADYSGPNFSATFQNAHDSGFILGASLSNPATMFVGVHESGSATNESFVYFDFATVTADFQERTVLHRKPDAMEHEPSRLLSDTERAANLVRANTVLAIRNHPNGDKPLVEWERGILEDSSHFAGELLASVFPFAFPHPASRDEANVIAATSGAFDAIRPATSNDEVEAVVGGSEVLDGLLESLWFGAHDVPHWQKYPTNALLSQVYYCPSETPGAPSTASSL